MPRPGPHSGAWVLPGLETPEELFAQHQAQLAGAGWTGSGSEAFDTLRTFLNSDPGVAVQLTTGMRAILEKYSPTHRGSRFTVGQASECLLAAVTHLAGHPMTPDGHDAIGYDLKSATGTGERWSVKSSYTRGGEIGITNGQGGPGRGLTHPMVVWSPCLPGLVYINPTLHPDVLAAQKSRGDSTTLPKAVVAALAAEHPECVIPLVIPENPRTAIEDPGWDRTLAILEPVLDATADIASAIEHLREK